MPIYNNNTEVKSLYSGNTEIQKVYAGDKIIYQKSAPKIDKILIHDFGGQTYHLSAPTSQWTVRKSTHFSSYWTMVLNPGVVPAFRMPFNATKATLLLECSHQDFRSSIPSNSDVDITFLLTNNYSFDPTSSDLGVSVESWGSKAGSEGAGNTNWYKNNQNYWGWKELDFNTSTTIPIWPNTKYIHRLINTGNGAAEPNPGFRRADYTDGTKDTYLRMSMYLRTNTQYNKGSGDVVGFTKLGKVYLDLTTDPQYQTYLNS